MKHVITEATLRKIIKKEISTLLEENPHALDSLDEGLWDDIKAAGSKALSRIKGEPSKEQPKPSMTPQKDAPPSRATPGGSDPTQWIKKAIKNIDDMSKKPASLEDFASIKDPRHEMERLRIDALNAIKFAKRAAAVAFDAYDATMTLPPDVTKQVRSRVGSGFMHESKLSGSDADVVDACMTIGSGADRILSLPFFSEGGAYDARVNLYKALEKFKKDLATVAKISASLLLEPLKKLEELSSGPKAARKPVPADRAARRAATAAGFQQ